MSLLPPLAPFDTSSLGFSVALSPVPGRLTRVIEPYLGPYRPRDEEWEQGKAQVCSVK
jgi:hypothetical protein